MPERWLSRCSTVTSSAIKGRSGPRTERAVLSRPRTPWSTRLITASAVKAFDPLAMASWLSTAIGMAWVRSARPNAAVTGAASARSTRTTPQKSMRSASAASASSSLSMS